MLFCALSWCARVRADDAREETDVLSLSIAECAAIEGAEIEKIVGLELASQRGISRGTLETATLRASLRCGDTHAEISVRDVQRANSLQLSLELGETRPEARPRLIALALAELIATSRLERAQPKVPPPTAAAPREPDPWLGLWLGGGAVHALTPTMLEPAVAIGADAHVAALALAVDLELDAGAKRVSQAALRARSLSLGLAPGVRVLSGPLALTLCVGLRLGYAWLAATSRLPAVAGRELAGYYVTPLVAPSLQLRIAAPWAVRLGLEFGYQLAALRGLDADGAVLLELRGLRASALLGVAFWL